MSKIGEEPIPIPDGVNLKLEGSMISVSGPKGTLNFDIPQGILVNILEKKVSVQRESDDKLSKSLHGLVRTIISNMITGTSVGFQKQLEIVGTGYRSSVSGKKLILQVGFSHQKEVSIPDGINVSVDGNIITVSGINKEEIGNFAAKIRSIRPPEPYKGKGIRYKDEKIKRKAGKSGKISAK